MKDFHSRRKNTEKVMLTKSGLIVARLPSSVASLVAQTVKNLPATQETWVQTLGWEDPLEKGVATHSSILACRIPWTQDPGKPQSMGSLESDTAE